ncbi:GNAT family N-acetyltransferase [Maritimibacter fusiformis]|uniref:GNAT family N-acetyltransferase n=1 Tax=Maritimibacter fusiformis TaxID=2603819 RepID=A0A5D0RNZ9_9RHOB|nr:GNAT family N-acetyltransferase [Maritimibacter fusiformis]TYB83317.1 GNAT family N-acetyltransferase [Maritimibacter fusiformis]
MAITEGHTQTRLAETDIDAVMALVAEAGWNQVAEDWRLMAGIGDAVVLRDAGGAVCASALALPYAAGFGWISMVLVAKASRRRGLATHLLADRVAWLKARGAVPILDATELGVPVYEQAGFTGGARLSRWQGVARPGKVRGDLRVAGPSDRAWIGALDAEVFGADRSRLIDDFLSRPGSTGLALDDSGFVIARRGRRATQLGPLVAASEPQAIALLDAALASLDGPVFFDLFDARGALEAHVRALGYERQRGFLRMSLGEMPDFDGNGRAMLIAGPEYG